MTSFGRADDTNIAAMRNWVMYLYNYAPSRCFGSPERFTDWTKKGGLNIPIEKAESEHV